MKQKSSLYPFDDLQIIWNARTGGASMFKGADWQVLVALDSALELIEGHAKEIWLEGLEDIDVFGNTQRRYIQAKSLKKTTWSAFQQALSKFLPILEKDRTATFVFAVTGSLDGDLNKLVRLHDGQTIDGGVIGDLKGRVRKSCRGFSVDPEELLRNHVRVKVSSRDELWEELIARTCETAQTTPEGAELHLRYMFSHLVERSAKRQSLKPSDILEIFDSSKMAAARERSGYEAVSMGVISKVSWTSDATPSDFHEGKAVRAGHIGANLDVHRPKWMLAIKEALGDSTVCVVRAASGQGKSTLMFRYACEHFKASDTYIVRACRTDEQIEAVVDFLETKSRLGREVFLLVDGGDWRTAHWPIVAQKCAEVGFKLVVAVRNEDFARFGSRIGFKIEEVVPTLNLQEARVLHKQLQQVERLHATAPGPEEAFELIGEPRLLMEYVYLLTHGELLRERLEEQIRRLESEEQGSYRLKALRIVSTAHALGAPTNLERLVQYLKYDGEPRTLLRQLHDEYLTADDGRVSGLHWVRSAHIAALLHGDFVRLESTISEVLGVIEPNMIREVVANALTRHEISVESCIKRIVAALSGSDTALISAIEGAFDAAVQRYIEENETVFDDAFKLRGQASLTLLSMSVVVTKNQIIDELAAIPSEGVAPDLKRLSDQLPVPDYFSFVRLMLQAIEPTHLDSIAQHSSARIVGEFLDWCFLSGHRLGLSKHGYQALFNRIDVFESDFYDLIWFLQGLGRYDTDEFEHWVQINEGNLISRFSLELGAPIQFTETGVDVEFLVTPVVVEKDINEQVVTSLTLLRRAFPNRETYSTSPTSILPEMGLPFEPEREAKKNIPAKNLLMPSDVEKNSLIMRLIEQLFQPRTLYNFAKRWEGARKVIHTYLTHYLKLLEHQLAKRNPRRSSSEPNVMECVAALRLLPPHPNLNDSVANLLEGAKAWASAVGEFFWSMQRNQGDHQLPLAAMKIRKAANALSGLHDFFAELQQLTVGFNCDVDCAKEEKTYRRLARIIEAWAENPNDPNSALRGKIARSKVNEKTRALMSRPSWTLGTRKYEIEQLLYLAVSFEVENPMDFENELVELVECIPLDLEVSFFELIPTKDGKRFIDVSYRVNSWARSEKQIDFPQRTSLEALETLPALPLEVDARIPSLALVGLLYLNIQTAIRWYKHIQNLEVAHAKLSTSFFEKQYDLLHGWMAEVGSECETAVKKNENSNGPPFEDANTLELVRLMSESNIQDLVECVPAQTYLSPSGSLMTRGVE